MVRLAANLSFLFKESADFLGRFRAAAHAGFNNVEFMFPGDGGYIHTADDVAKQLEEHSLKQVLLNAPAGDWANGERGVGGIPGREQEWEQSISAALKYAERLRCPNVHVMAGLRQHGASEEIFVERMRRAADLAGPAGVTLLVEPLNSRDFPGYLVPTTRVALDLLEKIDRPSACRLQLDLYHMQVSEGDLTEGITRLLPHAAHVQIANPPGRHEPTKGEVNFEHILSHLDEQGYPGYVGLEYKPYDGTLNSLAWAKELLHARRG